MLNVVVNAFPFPSLRKLQAHVDKHALCTEFELDLRSFEMFTYIKMLTYQFAI